MAKDHRFFEANCAKASVIVIVEIGTANAPCLHSDQYLSRSRRGHLGVFDTKVFRSMCDDGFHKSDLKEQVREESRQ